MAELLSLEEAQRRILEHVEPLTSERVWLEEAAGRVLAEAALSRTDLPPFDASAMDGFAVGSVDTPGRLPVVARIAAGAPAPRIATAEMPPAPRTPSRQTRARSESRSRGGSAAACRRSTS